MNKFSLKALGATLIAVALVVFGAAIPAHAAAATMNRTAVVVPGSTNTLSASVLFDATPSNVDSVSVRNNTSKISFTSTSARTQVMAVGVMGVPCGTSSNVVVKVMNGPANIYCTVNSNSVLVEPSGSSTFATGLIFTVQLGVGAMSFNATGPWPLYTALQNTATAVSGYAATFDLTDPNGAPTSYTVTFDANGGTGTTAAQTASASGALTANGFSKAGYTFAGWNTAANGTGVAYADGASYPFSSSTTLFAQWTATLANTGFDGAPYLLVGNLLGVLGVAVLLIGARRRQTS